jgi:hypothetical protein
LKDIIVKDINDVNKEDGVLILRCQWTSTFNNVRKSLEKDIKYPYVFLSNEKGFKISLGSEKTKRISSILGLTGGDTIYIKTSKPEK